MRRSSVSGVVVLLVAAAGAAAVTLGATGTVGCTVTGIASAELEPLPRDAATSVWIDVAALPPGGRVVAVRAAHGLDEPAALYVVAGSRLRRNRVTCRAGSDERVELALQGDGARTTLRIAADGDVDVLLHRAGSPLLSERLPAAEGEAVELRW